MINSNININELSTEIVKRLLPLNPLKIILFGSYAYGQPTIDSDIDICVIQDSENSKAVLRKKIRHCLSDITIPKDIVVAGTGEFEFYKKEYGSVFMDIDQKGILLWTRK